MALDTLRSSTESVEKYGQHVHVNALYFRHAEKASGAVGTDGEISYANISERGAAQSSALGAHLAELITPGKDGVKIGHSDLARTHETARALADAYRRADDENNFHDRQKIALSATPDAYSPEFMKAYISRWEANKVALLKAQGMEPSDFARLSTQEQAAIAEAVEEPVMREWLDDPQSEMARLYPPEEAAARLAVLVRRDMHMATRLKSGSEVDLIRATHKTICEPLLMRILQLPDTGERPKVLAEIGGSFGLNDGWGIEVQTDAQGNPSVSAAMYRVVHRDSNTPKYEKHVYRIDLNELDRLAEEGLAARDPR